MTSCEHNLLVKNAKNALFSDFADILTQEKVSHEETKETNICQKIFI